MRKVGLIVKKTDCGDDLTSLHTCQMDPVLHTE